MSCTYCFRRRTADVARIVRSTSRSDRRCLRSTCSPFSPCWAGRAPASRCSRPETYVPPCRQLHRNRTTQNSRPADGTMVRLSSSSFSLSATTTAKRAPSTSNNLFFSVHFTAAQSLTAAFVRLPLQTLQHLLYIVQSQIHERVVMYETNNFHVVLCPSQQILATLLSTTTITRMWANAQPDGRPAEHRWRPLFNAPKFG